MSSTSTVFVSPDEVSKAIAGLRLVPPQGDAWREIVGHLAFRHASDMMGEKQLLDIGMLLAMVPWQQGDLVVEIGTYHGRTAAFMAEILRRIGKRHVRVVGIDPFEVGGDGDPANPRGSYSAWRENTALYADQCVAIVGFSSQVADVIPAKIGFLLVDGRHAFEDCLADLTLYVPKVKPGGFVFVDDDVERDYPGVVRAIDTYFTGGDVQRSGMHAVARIGAVA